MTGGGRLLVNFVYCHPVGHVIEALHYCHGYHLAAPGLSISVALNSFSPYQLASLCPFIEHVYPVSLDVFCDAAPRQGMDVIPQSFDWVVDDWRGHQEVQRALFPGIGAYYDDADARFGSSGAQIGPAGAAPPEYVAGGAFRLPLPEAARHGAEQLLRDEGAAARGPRIAILPAGSAPRSFYPSLRSWNLIMSSLAERWPEATFCLMGKRRVDGRTTTSFDLAEMRELLAHRVVVDVVDRDLVDQLAVVATCDVFVSPHTGFGMAALAVGTPWLSIAGNRWPEYYFNGVPFYSVLPDVTRYPAFQGLGPDPEPVEDDGPRSPSMASSRIREDLEEIVDGAARLIEGRWPFETAMADHFARMKNRGRSGSTWSVDGVHRGFLH